MKKRKSVCSQQLEKPLQHHSATTSKKQQFPWTVNIKFCGTHAEWHAIYQNVKIHLFSCTHIVHPAQHRCNVSFSLPVPQSTHLHISHHQCIVVRARHDAGERMSKADKLERKERGCCAHEHFRTHNENADKEIVYASKHTHTHTNRFIGVCARFQKKEQERTVLFFFVSFVGFVVGFVSFHSLTLPLKYD